MIRDWPGRVLAPKQVQEPTSLEESNGGEAARSEMQEYLFVSRQRHRVLPRAALVGAGAGLTALLFRAALAGSDSVRNALIGRAHDWPVVGWILPMLFTMVGAVLSVALTRRYAPDASGSGIPHLEAVLHRLRQFNWRRILPVKLVGGILAIGSGLPLGREGPTVQMGGAVGAAVAQWLKVSGRERLTLITAGAGAGLAAAFNAPLSGLVFVLEEVRRDFQPIVFGAAFVAAVVADIIARIGAGQFPVFAVPSYPVTPLAALPIFALLGIVAGLLGVLFNRSILAAVQLYARIPPRFALAAAALTGGVVGLVGWFSPVLIGSGHSLVESALAGNFLLATIPLFFVIRFVLTSASYGTGAPGGIFAPLLVLGALLGLAIGQISHSVRPDIVPIPAVFAVVGMAAYFTAIVRAPLTGIMLIVEMTGNYNQMLPLLVSCFCAYVVTEYLKELPIYEALLERDLTRSGDAHRPSRTLVAEFIIQPDAPFAGREIRSLGLPPGCILVRCSDGQREWVPTADTYLEPYMRITVMVAPEVSACLATLRQGCESAFREEPDR